MKNVEIAQLLLDAGVDIQAQDLEGWTALVKGICYILPLLCVYSHILLI